MSLWNYLVGVLKYWGFVGKSGKLVLLGLDNAGKTTLMYMLKENRLLQHSPTPRPNCEELKMDGMTFKTFDLGGHMQARRVWKQYFPAVDGIVFVIDVADLDRFPEAKREFDNLLDDEQIEQIPIVILGNKIDKHDAASEDFIRQYFGLYELTRPQQDKPNEQERRPIQLFMTSVVKREGYGKAFRWLSKLMD